MNRLVSLGAGTAAATAVNIVLGIAVVEAAAPPDIFSNRINCICVFVMAPPPSFPEIRDWNSLEMTLTRGPCFGTCPIYAVTIHGDGHVAYEGGQFTAQPGKHEAHVPFTAVLALFGKFRDASFFTLNDAYKASITDNPTYTVTLRYDDHAKRVIDYVGGAVGMPIAVSQIEDAIDQTANTAQWIKAPDAVP